MATYAARRLGNMCFNTSVVVGIEAMAAARGLDFHRPLQSSATLESEMKAIRQHVAFSRKRSSDGAGCRNDAFVGVL